MRRFLKKFPLILLALLFMLEAWLWEVTGAAIRHALGWVPYHQFKAFVAKRVVHLSPWTTLGIFIIPALLLLPLKFATVWLLAHGSVVGGIGMALLAKLIGLGVSSFLFTLCKPKLLQLRFVRWLYNHCVYWRQRARDVIAPYLQSIRRMKQRIRALFPRSNLFQKMRAQVKASRNKPAKQQP